MMVFKRRMKGRIVSGTQREYYWIGYLGESYWTFCVVNVFSDDMPDMPVTQPLPV